MTETTSLDHTRDCGRPEAEAKRTIKSGVEAGMQHPRERPAQPGRVDGDGRLAMRDDSWPDSQPLPSERHAVLPFDPAVLPEAFRGWITDIAERTQCPIDFPAVGAMVSLAGVVGRKVGIRPKRYDDWLVVPNLWGAAIGPPGIMKTPAIQESLKPLLRLEIEAARLHEKEKKDSELCRTLGDARRKDADRRLQKAVKDNDVEQARQLAEQMITEQTQQPVRRRYVVNDSTVEKLGEILNQNPFGVVVYRDELIGLLRSLDKEGQEGARAFYLEAWNGTGRYTYDRIGRGTLDIEAATVSIIGGIQPGPHAEYRRGAISGGAGDDGLIQRFQLAVWPDVTRTWRNVDRWPDKDAKNRAYEVFRRLDKLDNAAIGAERDPDDPQGIPFLRFSPAAQAAFDDWRGTLETKIRSGEEHAAIESHLAKYRSLIPSLALLTHLSEGIAGPVVLESLRKAIGWGEYLESHARRILSVNSDAAAANALARKIIGRELGHAFALRDVYRPCWSGLGSRDEAARAVALLMDLDWLQEVKEQTPGAPRTRYLVNPKVYDLPATSADKTDRSPRPAILSALSVAHRLELGINDEEQQLWTA